MYGIYKQDDYGVLTLVAVCYTKIGAKRSCRHFKECYADENDSAYCHVEYRHLDPYWMIKIGYSLLRLMRNHEKNKLAKLENRENLSRALRENQEAKIRSLY